MYLGEFVKYSKNHVAYLPLGTIEWHGNHLPIETDYLVAQKLCYLISKKHKGYVLPPIYLGTDRVEVRKGRKFIGMNIRLEKELAGSLYYLSPKIMSYMVEGLVQNLVSQGFNKIYIITGHAGSKQIEVLNKISEKNKNVFLFNPYKNLDVIVDHADEYETSLYWACFPEEEQRSRKNKINKDDDYIKYKGYDPRQKASLNLGKKILNQIMKNFEKIKK